MADHRQSKGRSPNPGVDTRQQIDLVGWRQVWEVSATRANVR